MKKRVALVTIAFLLMLLTPEAFILTAYAPATHAWQITLKQTKGTTAIIYDAYFTLDEVDVSCQHIPAFACPSDGNNEVIMVLKPTDLTAEPNDFHFATIVITWPDSTQTIDGPADFLVPGSLRPWTHGSDSVTLAVTIATNVGGVVIAANKLVLLAPFIGLASIAAVGAVIAAKKYRRKK